MNEANLVVPDTLQQIVAWQVCSNITYAIIFTLLIIALSFLLRPSLIKALHKEDDTADVIIVVFGGTLFITVTGILLLVVIPALIKALTAPNLVIIERLGGLVR